MCVCVTVLYIIEPLYSLYVYTYVINHSSIIPSDYNYVHYKSIICLSSGLAAKCILNCDVFRLENNYGLTGV